MSPFRLNRVFQIGMILLFSNAIILGQQKLNLDFETLSVEGLERPWGWSVYSYAPEVTSVCDKSIAFSGKYSLKIKNELENDSNRFELSFFIEPNQILNKTITIDGWAKSEGFLGSSGINVNTVGAIGDEYGTLRESEVAIKDSEDWTPYNTEINIDSHSHSLLITLFFEGIGTVWFDNIQLRINGKLVNEVAVAEKFTEKQLHDIAKETVAFTTVEPSSQATLKLSDFKDLEHFKHIAGGARIIALGESTHGTSEFFKVKHRLLQYAILELGVNVFILEDNQLLVERINDYVLYGKGKAEAVITGLFAVWNTVEMLELIKWIRSFNIAHPNGMVEFVGMDVQNPQLAIDHLNTFLEQKDTILQKKSGELVADIKQEWRNSYFKTDSILAKWDENAATNFNVILSNKNEWLSESKSRSDSLEVEWAIKNSRTIKQFVETALGGVYEGRDKAMAENVEWIINQRKSNARVLIWAHDSHVSRGDATEAGLNFFFGNSMGAYLSKRFKEEYRAFGLSTYQGSCLGTVSYSNFNQVPFEIYTSPDGSLDEALNSISDRLNKQNLILNLRSFKNNSPEFDWVNRKRPVRYVGYVAEDYGFGGRYSIPYQFDGIVFIDKTKASSKVN